MSAYVASLNRELGIGPSPCAVTLEARYSKWFLGLPEVVRVRAYTMGEIEMALSAPGRLISLVLIAHGWTRKRKWDSRHHYHRYWLPPHANIQ